MTPTPRRSAADRPLRAGGVSEAVVLWRRLDVPGHDSARLTFHRGRRHLAGTAVYAQDGRACRLDYEVTCDERWRTMSAVVDGWIGGEGVHLTLLVDAAGRWSCNGRNVLECAGCVDVDLSFTPATNLLPIRRLALDAGDESRVVAAWLRVPELTLSPLEQRYRRLDAERYAYESRNGEFTAELTVNAAGFVTRYPPLWTEEVLRA